MSRRRRSSEHGFTILECEIALLVLTLAVILMAKMISSHDVLLQSMDGWLMGDQPTWYVVPRENDFERALEHAPDLLATAPSVGGSSGGPGGGKKPKYVASVLSTTRTLDPPTLSVLVNLQNRKK
jgi:hypothetical protein